MENTTAPCWLLIIGILLLLFACRHRLGKCLEGYGWYRKMQKENLKYEEEKFKRDEVIDIHDRFGFY